MTLHIPSPGSIAIAVAAILVITTLACGLGSRAGEDSEPNDALTGTPTVPIPLSATSSDGSDATANATVAAAPASTDLPDAAPPDAAPTETGESPPTVSLDEAEKTRERFEYSLRATWATDFRRTNIDFSEIITGGPPKDGIRSIDDPAFESLGDANDWLHDLEPVQVVDINGEARGYPVQIMIQHELVNDTVGGEPVVITY